MLGDFKSVSKLVSDAKYPKMVKIRQHFPNNVIEDIEYEVRAQLSRPEMLDRIKLGMRIAITAGSRGISNIALIIKTVCAIVKEQGGIPYIIPAMGSRGGGTAQGQRNIIESYGITEEYCQAEIYSCMDVKHIGDTEDGDPVYIDRFAAESDGIIVIGRIKPHTDFRGPYESGIMKMMVIGLGKQYGAEAFHASGPKHMACQLPAYGKAIVKNSPVLFGLAIIENAYDETYKLTGMLAEEFETMEPPLLNEAKQIMGRILFDSCDVLIVDYIGKDISGDGMDPNVTGTFSTEYASGGIKALKRVVLDITPASHGCCVGVGMADVATKRLFDKADFEAGYVNSLTCTMFAPSKIPLIIGTDKEAIGACLKYCGGNDKDNPRVIRITDTLHLGEIWISEAMLEEAKQNPQIEIMSEPKDFPFDENGSLH